MNNKEIANTILKQIGKGALFMLGGKDYIIIDNGVTFRIRGSKITNCIKIELMPSDTYKVTFLKIWGTNMKVVSVHDDIYCDMLCSLIERVSGLYTHL